jgi:hypothetical protein
LPSNFRDIGKLTLFPLPLGPLSNFFVKNARNTGGGWSREHHNPLMRDSRDRTRHTPGREHETLRSIHRREEYEGEKERGQSRPRGGDPEGPGTRKPYTPMLPLFCPFAHFCITGKLRIERFPV